MTPVETVTFDSYSTLVDLAAVESALSDAVEDPVLTNGDPGMLASMAEHAGIEDLLEDTSSADEVGTCKPNGALSRHAAARTGTPIDRIAHVSALYYDVLGASHTAVMPACGSTAGLVPGTDSPATPRPSFRTSELSDWRSTCRGR